MMKNSADQTRRSGAAPVFAPVEQARNAGDAIGKRPSHLGVDAFGPAERQLQAGGAACAFDLRQFGATGGCITHARHLERRRTPSCRYLRSSARRTGGRLGGNGAGLGVFSARVSGGGAELCPSNDGADVPVPVAGLQFVFGDPELFGAQVDDLSGQALHPLAAPGLAVGIARRVDRASQSRVAAGSTGGASARPPNRARK